jgi:hypothetical protein
VEILVLHPGGLGDSILSFPAIALLRRQWPSANVTLAGNIDHLAPIAASYAERIRSLSTLPIPCLYANEDLLPEETVFWKSYDRIISWTGSGNPTFEKRLRELRPDACIGTWKPKPGDMRHVSRLFADSLRPIISFKNTLDPARIYLDSKTRTEGARWLVEHGWNKRDAPIAIHPGAGSVTKRWPLERFIGLARHLAGPKQKTLLVMDGPAEPGLARQMVQALSMPGVILMEEAPLGLLAALIEKCCLFVGNDSGLAHLAAALDVPCIVLFGPTLPDHWAPLGPNVCIVRNPQDCEGCASRSRHHTCLENITVEKIIQSWPLTRLT